MATNKWLSDLRVLKSNTDTLRGHLRDGGVTAYDNDTLQTLIGKVPSLAPIEDSDKWQPDPLWKFPDPNGSGELKTIREIWDEDTMASSYTYRSICQIIGDYDTTDLKTGLGTTSRTSADTFVLSDGTVYENITTTSLVHTWDKSKDVIDSKGRPMRYVRVYSKTVLAYMPNFQRTTIWCIFNMATSSVQNLVDVQYTPCECLELGDKLTSISSFGFPFSLKKIVVDGAAFYGVIQTSLSKLSEIEVKAASNFNVSGNNSYQGLTGHIKNLTIPSNYTGTSFNLNGYHYRYGINIDTVDMSAASSITGSVTCSYAFVNKIILPPNATSFSTTELYLCEEIALPNTLTSLSINGARALKKITLPESLTSLTNFTNMGNLRQLNVPAGFNFSINISGSTLMEHDSLVNILENLADLTGQSAKTITFGSTNLAKLTNEEKAIATNKNWTLS